MRACRQLASPAWSLIRLRRVGPLSAYLLSIAMATMWHDVRADLQIAGKPMGPPDADIREGLYGEDTVTLRDAAGRAGKVLRLVQQEAVHYALRLHRSKCEAIALREPWAEVRFEDGAVVAQPAAAKYLGCHAYASVGG